MRAAATATIFRTARPQRPVGGQMSARAATAPPAAEPRRSPPLPCPRPPVVTGRCRASNPERRSRTTAPSRRHHPHRSPPRPPSMAAARPPMRQAPPPPTPPAISQPIAITTAAAASFREPCSACCSNRSASQAATGISMITRKTRPIANGAFRPISRHRPMRGCVRNFRNSMAESPPCKASHATRLPRHPPMSRPGKAVR